MAHPSEHLHRRRFLLGTAMAGFGSAVGCRRPSESSAVPATQERRDVPLRIALAGAQQDAESIRRGWAAVTEQPIEFQTIEVTRDDAGAAEKSLMDAAARSDLVIYPLAFVAQATIGDTIVALSDDDVDEIDQSAGNLLPALRSGAARYAGHYFCVPLGAALPALLTVDDIGQEGDESTRGLDSWDAYDRLVGDSWDGMAGEPTAPGWAGAMYLWRTAEQKSWLFHREDLHPLVDNDSYVESLELMVKTCKRYKTPLQRPDQVFSAVQAGELRGGIGFPTKRAGTEGEFQIRNLPGSTKLSKLLLDPFSPVISLTSSCRQSAVAKRFIGWISGGEGSNTIRQQIPGMTEIRVPKIDAADATKSSGYDAWLSARLSSPVTQPTIQLLRAGDYYAALDHQVSLALSGEITARQALTEVANAWEAITKEVGAARQQRAWRRAQGIRG